jgi:hypothetical protein
MGQYIEKSDVEDVFGTTNVAKWSSLDGKRQADDDRIDRGIDWAESFIEARMRRSVYEVPMQATSGSLDRVVVNWMAVYAGHWLYMNRQIRAVTGEETERTLKLKESVDKEIDKVLARQLDLTLVLRESNAPTAPFHVR